MTREGLTRRGFLAAGSAVLAGTPGVWVRSAGAAAAVGANERINIGCIGVGGRGNGLMHEVFKLADSHNAAVTAVCDVWQPNLKAAAARVKERFGTEPVTCTRFGELLSRKNVDAVIIATPDFSHTPILIEALKAGKDAYVEKPMSMEIAAANEALDLTRKLNRVVQVGTQRRSSGHFKSAAKLFATGILGQTNRIDAAMNVNGPRWARGYDNCKKADVDWDAYLFNLPKIPFDPKLLRRWHFYRQFTNGIPGLWMAHYADAVNMVTGFTYPESIAAHGGLLVWHDGREVDDTFHALIKYPEACLFSWGMSLGNAAGVSFDIRGTYGSMDLERWRVSPEGGDPSHKFEPANIEPDQGESHMANFLSCLRSRKDPNADIETGHQHAVATIMAAEARESGKRQVWDPAKRQMRAG